MNQYTITIRDTGNFIRYDLTDDHGCVCASISAEAWDSGLRGFRPTELRCIPSAAVLGAWGLARRGSARAVNALKVRRSAPFIQSKMLATIHLNDRETSAWATCVHTRATVVAYARLRAARAGRRFVQIVASDARILKVLEIEI